MDIQDQWRLHKGALAAAHTLAACCAKLEQYAAPSLEIVKSVLEDLYKGVNTASSLLPLHIAFARAVVDDSQQHPAGPALAPTGTVPYVLELSRGFLTFLQCPSEQTCRPITDRHPGYSSRLTSVSIELTMASTSAQCIKLPCGTLLPIA